MSRCIYCQTEVPDVLMGYHYAGFNQPPCPDVAYAFGPEPPRRPTGPKNNYPLPGEFAACGEHGKGQTRAEYLERHRALQAKYDKKRRAASHAGVSL